MITTRVKREKKPAHDIAFAVDKNVDDITVAVNLFINVATLIDFARIPVGKTSAGISHAPGPIPTLNVARYSAKENTANHVFGVK